MTVGISSLLKLSVIIYRPQSIYTKAIIVISVMILETPPQDIAFIMINSKRNGHSDPIDFRRLKPDFCTSCLMSERLRTLSEKKVQKLSLGLYLFCTQRLHIGTLVVHIST